MPRRPPAAQRPPAALAPRREASRIPSRAKPVPEDLRLTFARNLKAARKSAGLSQGRLSEAAGVSRYYISQIETGAANVTLDMVSSLARVLGLRPEELLQPVTSARKKT